MITTTSGNASYILYEEVTGVDDGEIIELEGDFYIDDAYLGKAKLRCTVRKPVKATKQRLMINDTTPAEQFDA